MTLRDYTANVISASKVVPDGNFKDSKASGVWDINEALDLIKGGNWPNVANINPDTFVDALFQTHLYTGNNTSTAINNGINLSGKGGMVWTKNRDDTQTHFIHDTLRGATKLLSSNDTNGEETQANSLTSFNSNGFTVNNLYVNNNGDDYVSWTFRKQPKFFDVVTYSGQNTDLALSHNLGVAPGMVIVKRYDTNGYDWYVYHRSLNLIDNLVLNSNGDAGQNSLWTSTSPTSTTFNLKGNTGAINQSGGSYVAYLFAHNNNDGGFGEPGDQDIIKCGSYTGNGSSTGPEIDLGFEPQLIIIKKSSGSANWTIVDTLRGITQDGDHAYLQPNVNAQEFDGAYIRTLATGFQPRSNSAQFNTSGGTYIYMAIRRGGMQTPSTPSTVFNIGTVQTDTNRTLTNSLTGNLSPDFVLYRTTADGANWFAQNRLMGKETLFPNTDAAANTSSYGNSWGKVMQNVAADGITSTGTSSFGWMWARARGYFDVVAYTGTGSATTVTHNLGVVPEMIWVKDTDATENWPVYHKGLDGGTNPETHYIRLNQNNAEADSADWWNDTAPTASVFSVGTQGQVNTSGNRYIAYLFATVAGVTKLGSYTGNDGTTNVDCGFTNGARFVLIKKMNGTGDWVVLDSERGIVDGNTPYLRLNTTDAQDNLGARDIIDPLASGFTINANMGGVNDNGDTFLFYAIAADPS